MYDTNFHADNILDFVIDVISLFSSIILSTIGRVSSAGVQRSTSTRTSGVTATVKFIDELYRCCHSHSNGSLLTFEFPEFGTAKGRVGFYIPAKKWGVELLRDGDQLAEHSGRFSSQGSYGPTVSTSETQAKAMSSETGVKARMNFYCTSTKYIYTDG
jgi:hypothetical protein